MSNFEKLHTSLEQVGGLHLDSLLERKLLQKRIYFVQEFGVDLGYSFTYYIYGPYSPELTSDAFHLRSLRAQVPDALEDDELDPTEQAALAAASAFLETLNQLGETEQAYWLELASSVHFLWTYSNFKNKRRIVDRLMSTKPIRQSEDIETVWDILRRHDLISIQEA